MNTTDSLARKKDEASLGGEMFFGEEREQVVLPLAAGKNEEFVECCINGYVYVIQRGRAVMVPKPVAAFLRSRGMV
ncbi:MAG: hypothetical protein ACOYI4_00860 [Christensenellales bacterium]|jgi:hypothetical protein